MPKIKKKTLTKKELYEQKKREMEEDLEYFKQVENPEARGGGRKFVEDTIKEEKKQEEKKDDTNKNYLDSKIGAFVSYKERLAMIAFNEIMNQSFPADWQYYCVPTDGKPLDVWGKKFGTQDGIVYIIRSPKGEVYIRAVKCAYDPDLDINAIKIMVVQIENTIDSWKGLLLSDNVDTKATMKKTSSDIVIPH
jgi:hypothetical protein